MKKKLVIIGASELQLPLIIKAKENGYETHVFAWECGDVGEKEADCFYPISIIEKEKILEKCKEINPDGVISIASDLAVITVNYVAENLGLVCNPTKYVGLTTNKYEMRKGLSDNNINCPKFYSVREDKIFNHNIGFPVIIKPTDRSGSRGVYKVEKKEDIPKAIDNALEQSFKKEVIVEQFISGKEYSVEFISQKGKHNFLAVTEKVTTGAPNFIEIGHIQGADLNEDTISKIENTIGKALDALKIENGASHSEIMITDNNEIYVIEIGARMGGDCIGSDLVKISTGIDYVNQVIDVCMGKKIEITKGNSNYIGIVRYIFNNEDLELLNILKKENDNIIYRVSNIEEIDDRIIRDSSMRYGFFIIKTNNKNIIQKIFK